MDKGKKLQFMQNRVNEMSEKENQACTDVIFAMAKNKKYTRKELLRLNKEACEKYKITMISNPMMLATYLRLLKDKKITQNNELFQLFRKRRIRTSSGIASVAVLTKPYPCPGKCLYCPTQKNVPKSYIDNEPAVMRAILAGYDPVKQIQIRLRGFELAGNPTDKIELIVMGGTFSYLPAKYQVWFILSCFMVCNNFGKKFLISNLQFLNKSKIPISELLKKLKKEQKKNEKAKYRIIGLTLETRPDYINKKEVLWFRELGCTRVELGVQSVFDEVLTKNNRGHLTDETIKATKLLKDAGFKICYHLMPNLYGSNLKKDLEMFKILFSDPNYQPDMIKIYPCVVTKYAELVKLYKNKKYLPYSDKELLKLLIEIKKIIPPYVRIQRLIRDIPKENIIAGSKISNLRQIIQFQNLNLKSQNYISNTKSKKIIICNCIRCREIREDKKELVKLHRIDYMASGGKEIFLEYVDKNNRLYAMLRLRINKLKVESEKCKIKVSLRDNYIKVLNNSAVIREVHTYGPMLGIGEKSQIDAQHRGLGKKLIFLAERISKKEFGLNKIAVISGIGVRDYYRKLGYSLRETYMVKNI